MNTLTAFPSTTKCETPRWSLCYTKCTHWLYWFTLSSWGIELLPYHQKVWNTHLSSLALCSAPPRNEHKQQSWHKDKSVIWKSEVSSGMLVSELPPQNTRPKEENSVTVRRERTTFYRSAPPFSKADAFWGNRCRLQVCWRRADLPLKTWSTYLLGVPFTTVIPYILWGSVTGSGTNLANTIQKVDPFRWSTVYIWFSENPILALFALPQKLFSVLEIVATINQDR